ncbi:TPA: VOC family protein [Vibrio cholerae]|nr:VOC family protein [Vibrio cholerae]
MKLKALSTCIITSKVSESKEFYVSIMHGKVNFDCGWYVNIEFMGGTSLQFMQPQSPDQTICNAAGLLYNFNVMDVDSEHERLSSLGMEVIMPLEDHPWGDRGFAIQDPNGVTLYIYSDRTPSPEFEQFYIK